MARLVLVSEMRIRHVGMRMHHGLLLMGTAMRSQRRRNVRAAVVAIGVPVGMFVRQLFMRMLVAVGLHQVQHNAEHD